MRTGAHLFVFGAWAIARCADISVPGGVIRAEKNSQVRMMGDQVELTGGTLTYQVDDPAAGQVEILTPSVSVRAREQGVYRIAIRKTGESEITAQSGRLVVMAPAGEQWLEAGQKMIARGPRANPQFSIVSALAWWKRLAWILQNMQIGGGGTVESGGGGEAQAAKAKETRSKPQSDAALSTGTAHSGDDRPKTSDAHSKAPSGSARSGDSRPNTSSGGSGPSHSNASHAAPAGSSGGSGSSHSSESHPAPASSNTTHASDSTAKGK